MKTTLAHFEYFKKRCLYWQQRMQLGNWNLYFQHKSLKNCMAETNWDRDSMKASITLGTDWKDIETNNEDLDSSALHEICHLLIVPLYSLTDDWSKRKIDEAGHIIINHLLKCILHP